MAYETKVMLKMLGKIVKMRSKSGSDDVATCRRIYNDISEVANAEGVTLKSFDEEDADDGNA